MQNLAGIFLKSLHEGNSSQVVLISRIRDPLALLKEHDPLALISRMAQDPKECWSLAHFSHP